MYFAHAKLCVSANGEIEKRLSWFKKPQKCLFVCTCACVPMRVRVVYKEYMYNVFIGERVWENGWRYRFKNLENVYEKCQRFWSLSSCVCSSSFCIFPGMSLWLSQISAWFDLLQVNEAGWKEPCRNYKIFSKSPPCTYNRCPWTPFVKPVSQSSV